VQLATHARAERPVDHLVLLDPALAAKCGCDHVRPVMIAVAREILDHVGVGYKGLNVLESADLRNGIKTYSNWPTIPQLYVKGEFVGGCDIIREMFQAGELQQLLADKGVAVSAAASA